MKGREKGLLDDESEALLIIDGFVDGIRQLYQSVLVYKKILIRNLRLNHPVNHHVGSLQNGKEGVLYVFLSDRALDRRMLRVKTASGGYEALDSVHHAFIRYQAQRWICSSAKTDASKPCSFPFSMLSYASLISRTITSILSLVLGKSLLVPLHKNGPKMVL